MYQGENFAVCWFTVAEGETWRPAMAEGIGVGLFEVPVGKEGYDHLYFFAFIFCFVFPTLYVSQISIPNGSGMMGLFCLEEFICFEITLSVWYMTMGTGLEFLVSDLRSGSLTYWLLIINLGQ